MAQEYFSHEISPLLQMQILEGFRTFYDKRHWKYKLIEDAVGIVYVNTITNNRVGTAFSSGTLTLVHSLTRSLTLTQ